MNNTSTTFYIVRHGQSQSNAQPLLGPQLEAHSKGSALTELGIQQASITARKLHHVQFDKAFSSDLIRAHKTAEIILKEKNIAIETTRLLRERSRGNITGKLEKQLAKKLGNIFDEMEEMAQAEKQALKEQYGVELREEITSRVTTFLREIAVSYPGKTILITCHGALMRALLIHLGYGTSHELSSGTVQNGAYVVIESDGINFFIKDTDGINKRKVHA